MLMLIINIVGILFSMLLCVISQLLFYGAAGGLGVVIGVLLLVLFCIMFAGLKVVNPNEALVLTLFGKYHGTIKKYRFFFVNRFCTAFNRRQVLGKGIRGSGQKLLKKKRQNCEGFLLRHEAGRFPRKP